MPKQLPIYAAAHIIVTVLANKFQPQLDAEKRGELTARLVTLPEHKRAEWIAGRYGVLHYQCRIPNEVLACVLV